MRRVTRFFAWGQNTADRLTFAEVLASGQALDANMDETYEVFGIERNEVNTMEQYMDEYFTRITKRLKEIDYQKNRNKKKKKPTIPYKNQF
jgi:hypothetical protein